MPETIICEQCKKSFVQEDGKSIRCEACALISDLDMDVILCRKCGASNNKVNYSCQLCGYVLDRKRKPKEKPANEAQVNKFALWSYYLGMVSVIPFLGIPVGIAAIILGSKGIELARPGTQDRTHSWNGMFLGTVFSLLYGVIFIAMIISTVCRY